MFVCVHIALLVQITLPSYKLNAWWWHSEQWYIAVVQLSFPNIPSLPCCNASTMHLSTDQTLGENYVIKWRCCFMCWKVLKIKTNLNVVILMTLQFGLGSTKPKKIHFFLGSIFCSQIISNILPAFAIALHCITVWVGSMSLSFFANCQKIKLWISIAGLRAHLYSWRLDDHCCCDDHQRRASRHAVDGRVPPRISVIIGQCKC